MMSSTVPVPPPAGSAKLTGTLIGTQGSYQNKGNTIANAVDGNLSTYFDAPGGVQGWVGIDLGTPETVTQIQFVPRSGFASRMLGGIFQASSSPDFSSGVINLYTVTTSPAAGVYTAVPISVTNNLEFVRYLAPVSGSGNVAEVEFDGLSMSTPSNPVTPPLPLPPTSLSATAVSFNDIRLSWLPPSTGTVLSYTLERQDSSTANYAAIGTALGTTTSFDDANAQPSMTYSYEIIANNIAGSSTASLPASATTMVAAPLSPVLSTATAISTSDIHLTWQEPTPTTVSTFTIERQGPTDTTYIAIGTTPGSATSFDDLNALASTTYSYTVIANNTTGSSPASAPISATTPATTPATPISLPLAPTSLVSTAISATDIHLTWQEDASSTVTSFTIERQGPNDATYSAIGTVPGTSTVFDDLTTSAKTTYAYEVIANNAAGSSAASSPASTTSLPAPLLPWSDTDIGAVGLPGSATVNTNGTITVTGSGADIWNTADAFNFESQTMVGNGTLIAQVTSQTNPSSWAKSGIMMRETLNTDSRYVLLALTPSNGVTLQARTATHVTPTISLTVPGKAGIWLELVRSGSNFSGFVSTDGKTWTLVGSVAIPMFNNIQAGLCVTAHNNSKVCTSNFSNVAITTTGTPASPWSAGAVAPIARWESESFTYNNQLYVFGGYTDRVLDATSECDVYKPANNTWSYVTSIPNGAITHAAVTLVGDTVYIAGGNIGSFGSLKTGVATGAIETYDITTGVWGSIQSLPSPVTSGGMVDINNELIYYGGINAASTVDLSNTWTLNLTNPNASWVAGAAMPNPRNHIGYVAINGLAYVVGGQHLYNETSGNIAEVDAYNPVTNSWTTVAPLPMVIGGIHGTTMVVNGKIVVVGGQTNGGYDGIYLNTIEEYDPVTNLWANVGTLPEANQGQSIGWINGELIVVDGTVDNLGGWAQNQILLDSSLSL